MLYHLVIIQAIFIKNAEELWLKEKKKRKEEKKEMLAFGEILVFWVLLFSIPEARLLSFSYYHFSPLPLISQFAPLSPWIGTPHYTHGNLLSLKNLA